VPSTLRQKPSSPLPLSQQALARPPRPPSLSSRPIWIESRIADGPSIVVALTRSVPKPASWFHDGTRALTYAAESATARPPMNGVRALASGLALTSSEAGLFLDDTVPDMSDHCCTAYFKRFKLQIGNILKETCSLPDGDRHDVEP
jgi:hypothetical protein